MKTRYIILSILSVALLSACNEKLLDIPQQGVISESNFYQTDDDAEQAIRTEREEFAHKSFIKRGLILLKRAIRRRKARES